MSSLTSVSAWRAGLGPSAPSLSPPAAASIPEAHSLPVLGALSLGLGPVMGTRVPTVAVVVLVSPIPPQPHQNFTLGVAGSSFSGLYEIPPWEKVWE